MNSLLPKEVVMVAAVVVVVMVAVVVVTFRVASILQHRSVD